MSLRTKFLLVIAIEFLFAFLLIAFSAQFFLQRSFLREESRETALNTQRVIASINNRDNEIVNNCSDWARWNDAYAFVEDRNSKFIKDNLVDDTFGNLRLNLIVFVHSSGRLVYAKAFDLEEKKEVPVPKKLLSSLQIGGPLLDQPSLESIVKGMINLPEGPLMFAALPILTSNKKGPIHGTLIMGRYLDPPQIKLLTDQTQLPFSIYRSGDSLSVDFIEALPKLTETKPIFVLPLEKDKVAGYAIIKDIYGKPGLYLRVSTSRDIYRQGLMINRYFQVILLIIGIMIIVSFVWLMESTILARLFRLMNEVNKIGASADLSARVSVVGHDELASLSKEINLLLGSLEVSHLEIKQSEKRFLEKLERLAAELHRADRTKSEFLANMSHELRTPLNSIIGFSEVLYDKTFGPLTEKQQKYVDNVLKSGRHLLALINEVLDMSKIEAGKMNLVLSTVQTKSLLRDVAMLLENMASKKKIEIKLDLPDSLPVITADERRVKEIVFNLLSNALKYSPEGGQVGIRARSMKTEIAVEVWDNGIGIAPENLGRVFEGFFRVEAPYIQLTEGTGLGLPLAKRMVELHGGKLTIESPGLNQGTVVKFTLPLVAIKEGGL